MDKKQIAETLSDMQKGYFGKILSFNEIDDVFDKNDIVKKYVALSYESVLINSKEE